MKLSLVIEAIDKASRNVKRITGNVRDLGTRGMGVVQRATQGANRVLGRFGQDMPGRLRAMTAAAARFAGRAGLLGIHFAAKSAGWAVGRLARAGADLAIGAAKWGTAAAGFAVGWGIKGIIQTGSRFEQFQVILENTEGSAAKARQAMSWVKDFAKTTPFEVGDVMEAFVRLRAYGIDPMNGSMRSLGNMASGMGKNVMDAVEMMADAQTGEFERLKEFGIKANVAGSKVTLTYLKNGKEIRKSVANSAVAINKAIRDIADDRFAGMMERQSRTVAGLWSNLQDMVANFQLDVADAGFLDIVKGKLQQLLDKVNELAANGTLAKWAKNVSDWLTLALEKGIDFVQKVDWKQFGSDLATVARAVWSIALMFAKATEWAGKLKNLWERMPAPVRMALDPVTPAVGVAGNIISRLTDGKAAAPAPRRQANSPLKAGQQPVTWPTRSAAAPAKGEIRVKVEAAPGTRARVSSVQSSPNLSLSASNRGRAMEAPA